MAEKKDYKWQVRPGGTYDSQALNIKTATCEEQEERERKRGVDVATLPFSSILFCVSIVLVLHLLFSPTLNPLSMPLEPPSFLMSFPLPLSLDHPHSPGRLALAEEVARH